MNLCVRADHPTLPGHFPGQPLVPGVILLSHALECAQLYFDNARQIVGIDHAKFLAPLRPNQTAQLTIWRQNKQLHFTIERGATVIAHGAFRLAEAQP
jgi:3-hydroxyacyl-[acyl-carrier-protein] dehydratase